MFGTILWERPPGYFFDVFDTILGIVETTAGAIDALLGTDMASVVSGFRGKMSGWLMIHSEKMQSRSNVCQNSMWLRRRNNGGMLVQVWGLSWTTWISAWSH